MKLSKFLLLGAFMLPLAACTSTAQFIASTATEFSSSTPAQVTTLADAVTAATLITNAADVYVNSGVATKAQLLEIQKLSNGVHAALTDLENDNTAGKSLVFGSFNAAMDAYNAYATTQGIEH